MRRRAVRRPPVHEHPTSDFTHTPRPSRWRATDACGQLAVSLSNARHLRPQRQLRVSWHQVRLAKRSSTAAHRNSRPRLRRELQGAMRRLANSIPIARLRRSGGSVQRDLLPTSRGAASLSWPTAARRVCRAKDSLNYEELSIATQSRSSHGQTRCRRADVQLQEAPVASPGGGQAWSCRCSEHPKPMNVPGVREETVLRYKVNGSAEYDRHVIGASPWFFRRHGVSPLLSMVRDSSATVVSGASRIPFERSS